jgi:ferritin-like metal-binding protein YciE
MKITNLHQLFLHELRDLHSAETQIIKALPKLIDSATNEDLKYALSEHLEVTKEHLARLDQIDTEIKFKKDSQVCQGIKGILTEGDKAVAEVSDDSTRDAAIIASAQKVEHYEMATYGTVVSYAREMSHENAADLLQQTLEEEGDANKTLTSLAEGGLLVDGINKMAMKTE